MKQKKTQVTFYFFLLIILSFSSHARTADLPGFFIGPGQISEAFGEMSVCNEPIKHSRATDVGYYPRCARPKLPDEDDHERNCAAAQAQCLDGCFRRIGRKESNAKTASREKDCHFMCNETYKSCMELN